MDTNKNEYWKAWRVKNIATRREQERTRDRERLYGVTPEMYAEMLQEQNYCCAICLNPFGDATPHVDHNHETNQHRGLLCRSCNAILGYAKENCEILRNAITYMQKYSTS